MSNEQQAQNDAAPFVDTPLLAAMRKAFDYPNRENLVALIAEAQREDRQALTALREERDRQAERANANADECVEILERLAAKDAEIEKLRSEAATCPECSGAVVASCRQCGISFALPRAALTSQREAK